MITNTCSEKILHIFLALHHVPTYRGLDFANLIQDWAIYICRGKYVIRNVSVVLWYINASPFCYTYNIHV